MNRPMLHIADTISLFAIVGALAQILPPLAALAGLVWYAIQIWESKTVQRWIKGPPTMVAEKLDSVQHQAEDLAKDVTKLAAAPDSLTELSNETVAEKD